ARQYALTIDEIAHKTPSMSLPEASDNEGRTRAALAEQNRLIDEQASRVKSLQEKSLDISMFWLTLAGQPVTDS
ncbi:putative tail length tape measure domain protein, partial [Escherichia coli DEC8E]